MGVRKIHIKQTHSLSVEVVIQYFQHDGKKIHSYFSAFKYLHFAQFLFN